MSIIILKWEEGVASRSVFTASLLPREVSQNEGKVNERDTSVYCSDGGIDLHIVDRCKQGETRLPRRERNERERWRDRWKSELRNRAEIQGLENDRKNECNVR